MRYGPDSISQYQLISIQLLKKRTLNPEITLLFMLQFHAQKALFEVPKICNINFWIENDRPPWNFSKISSDFVAGSFP